MAVSMITGPAPKTVVGKTINADNTIDKVIHLLMVLMIITPLRDKYQEVFESYYLEIHTLT
jgi:hypothetical protein